jgi:hypothetical protein
VVETATGVVVAVSFCWVEPDDPPEPDDSAEPDDPVDSVDPVEPDDPVDSSDSSVSVDPLDGVTVELFVTAWSENDST